MKHKRIFKLITYSIIILFIFSYTIEESGYYEYSLNNKKNLTEKEIKQFERDIKEGKEIDIKDYLQDNTTDYSSNLTKSTSNLSIKLNKYIKIILTDYFDIFKKLIK